jgi:hypothetical protein
VTTTSAKPKSRTSAAPVALDLDTIENEDPQEPFAVRIKGRRVELTPPKELDWIVAASINERTPTLFLESVMSPEDFDHFAAQKYPIWRVERMMDLYREHFGIKVDEGN